jgi:cellulose synthase/poly-beta-1,6-N-acetylglucosamine synthase-like glycosyltransferase
MYSPWLISFLMVAALATGQLALIVLNLWEDRRFAASRLRRSRKPGGRPRVALFAPCKGVEPGLKDNLRPLLEQDYPNYQLTFIVESADDPACEPIRELLSEYRHASAELLVAGRAVGTGQKVHNLRTAAADLPDDVELLAFVDSDARPRSNWLGRLVERLDRSDVGAITGYRWFVPTRNTLSNLISYSINSALAAGLGPGGHHLIWGGSWAIRRDVFEQVRLQDAWKGTLSDDLVATRVLHGAGFRVDFEPNCMLASPLDNDWRQTLSFMRRQYVIARSYLPKWWLLALIAATLPALTFWGGLALLVAGLATGQSWVWVPAVICPIYYATTVFRGWVRCRLACLYLPEHAASMRGAFRFDVWAGPVAGLVNWIVLLGSLFGSTLQWRGIRYRIRRGGQIQIQGREDNAADESRRLLVNGPHCLLKPPGGPCPPPAAAAPSTAS